MQRESELLPVAYFHIVFTLPHEFNVLIKEHAKEVYNTLFQAAWQTMQKFAQDKKYLGASIGMTAVLHTWGQQLWLHPHLHCIVPAGGITAQGNWKQTKGKGKYLFPSMAMASVFRAKYLKVLRKQLYIDDHLAKSVMQKPWVVYAKKPFHSPKSVIEYLGRYTHKVAISNNRIQNIEQGKVTFGYKDYKTGAQKKSMTLTVHDFLNRFAKHILPRGFVRMRHYGMNASRNKAVQLNIAKKHFGLKAWEILEVNWQQIALEKLKINPDICNHCQGELQIIQSLEPQRGPPIKPHHQITPNLQFNV